MILFDREKALEWWNSLTFKEREDFASQYLGKLTTSLTGREIEFIWKMKDLS